MFGQEVLLSQFDQIDLVSRDDQIHLVPWLFLYSLHCLCGISINHPSIFSDPGSGYLSVSL